MLNRDELIKLLNSDLINEYMHMHFYMNAALNVQGDYGVVREWLLHEAKSEQEHVIAFGDMIVGLGGMPLSPADGVRGFPTLSDPKEILEFAIKLEQEVTDNYSIRMKQAEEYGGTDGSWVHVFYEGQLQDSREDLDRLRKMLPKS